MNVDLTTLTIYKCTIKKKDYHNVMNRDKEGHTKRIS